MYKQKTDEKIIPINIMLSIVHVHVDVHILWVSISEWFHRTCKDIMYTYVHVHVFVSSSELH